LAATTFARKRPLVDGPLRAPAITAPDSAEEYPTAVASANQLCAASYCFEIEGAAGIDDQAQPKVLQRGCEAGIARIHAS